MGVQQRQENGERESSKSDSLLTGHYLCLHKCSRFVVNVCKCRRQKGRQSNGRKVVEVGLYMINCPYKTNDEK